MDPHKLSKVFLDLSNACQELGLLLQQSNDVISTTTVKKESKASKILKKPAELLAPLTPASTPSVLPISDPEPLEPLLKKKLSSKKIVDPLAPKKPPSSFFLFYKENYPIVSQTSESKKVTDIAKLIRDMWAKADHDFWDKKAISLRGKYIEDLKEYQKDPSNYRTPSPQSSHTARVVKEEPEDSKKEEDKKTESAIAKKKVKEAERPKELNQRTKEDEKVKESVKESVKKDEDVSAIELSPLKKRKKAKEIPETQSTKNSEELIIEPENSEVIKKKKKIEDYMSDSQTTVLSQSLLSNSQAEAIKKKKKSKLHE